MGARTRMNKSALVMFVILIGGFVVAGFLVPSRTAEGFHSPLPFFLWGMGGLFFLIILLVILKAMYTNRKRMIAERTWADATAEIVSVSQSGTVNRQPWMIISLKFEYPPGSFRETTIKQVVPMTALQYFRKGNAVRIKVNPENPDRIMVV
ncbi:MAG: DUF3592 domain-containing protein [Candidatus Aegiribacteria sp.]|nr:DUF3592 domain-containing protein [Candidatus Aegiribacteria sp.]MBD3295435.1 DUF3592 domain-containing protein [Candidatus Fermentibacteria bacterium]